VGKRFSLLKKALPLDKEEREESENSQNPSNTFIGQAALQKIQPSERQDMGLED